MYFGIRPFLCDMDGMLCSDDELAENEPHESTPRVYRSAPERGRERATPFYGPARRYSEYEIIFTSEKNWTAFGNTQFVYCDPKAA